MSKLLRCIGVVLFLKNIPLLGDQDKLQDQWTLLDVLLVQPLRASRGLITERIIIIRALLPSLILCQFSDQHMKRWKSEHDETETENEKGRMRKHGCYQRI